MRSRFTASSMHVRRCGTFAFVAVFGAVAGCSADAPPAARDAAADGTLDVTVDAAIDVPADMVRDAGTPTTVDCSVTLAADATPAVHDFAAVRSFFLRRCAAGSACHGAGGQGSLTLLGDALHGDLVGHASSEFPALPRIEPGHPERSWLWLKLAGCFRQLPGCDDPARPCGETMPTLSPISEGFALSEAAVLRAWILDGASP